MDDILKYIGGIAVAGGGLSLIIYRVFQHLGTKWLDAQFDERLQNLRHSQQREIEALRLQIATLLDRATKLHQREFEVLPKIWAKLNDAYWYVRQFVAAQQSYPDIDQMPGAQRIAFIQDCDLPDWQKNELSSATNKNDYYRKAIFWHKLAEAQTRTRKAYTYQVKNGIFISEDIRRELSEIQDLVWHALNEHETNEKYGSIPRSSVYLSRLNTTGDGRMTALERIIYERLALPQSDPLPSA